MKGKILSYTNERVKIYRIWGVGSNAAMIKLQLYALVAVGIRVTLGQDWHINYWDLFSSFLQLLFIQGEICNSGSTGPHHIKNSLHRWDAWGCIQLKLATYRLSCEIFWEGCRQKKRWKGLKGREESGEEGRGGRGRAWRAVSAVRESTWPCGGDDTGIVWKFSSVLLAAFEKVPLIWNYYVGITCLPLLNKYKRNDLN